LLLPLRQGHVFAVKEKLQVSKTPEDGAHPYKRHAGDNQQAAKRLTVTN
jgi:hypothetical protein